MLDEVVMGLCPATAMGTGKQLGERRLLEYWQILKSHGRVLAFAKATLQRGWMRVLQP